MLKIIPLFILVLFSACTEDDDRKVTTQEILSAISNDRAVIIPTNKNLVGYIETLKYKGKRPNHPVIMTLETDGIGVPMAHGKWCVWEPREVKYVLYLKGLDDNVAIYGHNSLFIAGDTMKDYRNFEECIGWKHTYPWDVTISQIGIFFDRMKKGIWRR